MSALQDLITDHRIVGTVSGAGIGYYAEACAEYQRLVRIARIARDAMHRCSDIGQGLCISPVDSRSYYLTRARAAEKLHNLSNEIALVLNTIDKPDDAVQSTRGT